MTEQEIRAVFDKLADVVCVLAEAAPNDKSEFSCQLDLKLTYQPGEKNRGSEDRTCFPWVFPKVSEARGLPIAHAIDTSLTTAFALNSAR
jgi:hypothetical protein